MDDLIAFVTARLDDDERYARVFLAVGQRVKANPSREATEFGKAMVDALLDDPEGVAEAMRWKCRVPNDLERVLREVAAKRAILRMHEPVPFWGNNPPPHKERTDENVKAWYCECQCPDGVIEGEYPCETARLLAAVWSDHPDYRAEWKP